MPRYALYGDSYVARLRNYKEFEIKVPGEQKNFGLSRIKTAEYPKWMMRELRKYKPTHVFLHVGGNDISTISKPRTIYQNIVTIVDDLHNEGVEHVFVGEILTRDCFSKSPGLTKTSFEKQRKYVNQLLHRRYGRMYVRFGAIKYPEDYDADRVHMSNSGMKKYVFTVKSAFARR